MNITKTFLRSRGYLLILLPVLAIVLPMRVFSQDINAKRNKTGYEEGKVKIAIANFKKLSGSPRLDVLETTIPHLFRASLFRWFEVVLANDLGGVAVESGLTTEASLKPKVLRAKNVRFTLEGTIIEIQGKIRVDIDLKDLTDNSTVLRKFASFTRETLIKSIEDELAKTILDTLRLRLSPDPKEKIVFAVVQPFNNKSTNKMYAFLETVLPESIIAQLSQAETRKERRNVSIKEISPEQGEPKGNDALVTGEYSIVGNEILISVSIKEQTGPTFSIQVTGFTDRILEIPEVLSNRILEVIKGRITAEGEWKDEPILLTNATAEQLFAKGEKYYQAKDYDSAVLMYRKAIGKKPSYLDNRFRLADIYELQNAHKSAISEYQKILDVNNTSAAAHYGLAGAYLGVGQYEDAAAEAKKAVDLARDDSEKDIRFKSFKLLGDIGLLQGEYEEAINNYLRAKSIDKQNPDIHLSLGRTYLAMGQLNDAIAFFDEGRWFFPGKEMEFRNDLASAHNALGEIHYNQKDYDEALAAFKDTIALSPENKKLAAIAYRYAGLIVAFFLEKDLRRGIEYLEKASSLEPDNEWNHRALGVAYHFGKEYEKAIESLKKALEIQPTQEAYFVKRIILKRLML
jgi:tetratricopeptide (TPR) repeat protein/TolB-like protein